ncbi:ubiquinol-cytochrome C reductase cytochrome C subunit [Saccharopolyspora subtropica]|uniref:Cytochrome bc1 complex cytochrome c subunit n=1 Tax=Saccharopolyspora thermophila TaxID=89367 RepID=A0A917KA95_9PSEU|nr:cytochrome c [Saccharopolyspora subtropica]GGJ06216.1 ubiquinol-cytochrome C reductase cytochrome C subunit [Saccharopolyspora subtropica]
MTTNKKRNRAGSKLKRRISGVLALGIALVGAGGLYTVVTPEPQTAHAAADPALVRQGEQLYNNACITCHGANLQGVQDRGPSLVGVGEAAVHFQVSTGRMPMVRQEAQAMRKPPKFSPEEIDALAAYVQTYGGGPESPKETGKALQGDDPARGGELYRLNCASCHNFTGRGIAMSSGKFAPNLHQATEQDIYEAMLTGPQNMPKFSDRQLTPEEKKDIIAYIKSVTNGNNNPGGNDLGGYGPGPETVIAWVVGLGALIGLTLWIGARA